MVAPERLELSFSTPITIKWIEAILGYEATKLLIAKLFVCNFHLVEVSIPHITLVGKHNLAKS